ncbi:unnamed protein product [Brassica rapa subsp. narinosa]
MEFFPLLELPEEIQAVVVEPVWGFTISSMFYPFPGDSICLLRLSLMKRAADAGYERDVYTHAMTRAIFEGKGKYFDGIPFESVDRSSKLVRSVKWGWGLWHGDYFRDHKVLFICFFMSSFYRCQCANLVQRQCHCLWHIDVTKDDNMCNRCFWIKEIGLFLRDFEPISLLRDTRKW